MPLDKLRQRSAPATNERKQSAEPLSIHDLHLGLNREELLTRANLESCSNDPYDEIRCTVRVTLLDRVFTATLTFANDLLVRVTCLFPDTMFDRFRQSLIKLYGNPLWTDLTSGELTWTENATDIIVFQYINANNSLFVAVLKYHEAAVKASSPASDVVPSDPSLRQTLDWLKDTFALSTYRYKVNLQGNVGETTVHASPAQFDSCRLVFDVIDGYICS